MKKNRKFVSIIRISDLLNSVISMELIKSMEETTVDNLLVSTAYSSPVIG